MVGEYVGWLMGGKKGVLVGGEGGGGKKREGVRVWLEGVGVV